MARQNETPMNAKLRIHRKDSTAWIGSHDLPQTIFLKDSGLGHSRAVYPSDCGETVETSALESMDPCGRRVDIRKAPTPGRQTGLIMVN
jgi:hypothetical protein